ncbi:MAG: Ig-like domain-containing protein [Flavisolibacter sp.]|nr:Ig-like domain-containing protein [Flavisolibacter sp.]
MGFSQCKKSPSSSQPPPTPPPASSNFDVVTQTINSSNFTSTQILYGVNNNPVIRISFTDKVDRNSVPSAIAFTNKSQGASNIPFSVSYQNNDSTIVITPSNNINYLNEYIFSISTLLKSVSGKALSGRVDLNFMTQYDPLDKFPQVSDTALVQLVQQQTFKYFWDFAHPVSGLARERNTSGETVTSGGSGFGIMAIITGIHRGFITRSQGLARMQTIVSFLKNTAQKFKGAFPHWLNGTTGAVIPFSTNDNGADLVETSFLVMGLLTARQYFNGSDAAETNLRNDINTIWNNVDWDFFRQGKKVLYWHWSPDKGFIMNLPVQGWNETLITYVLAASSATHGISKPVYDSGFARNGAIKNGNTYYGYQLPLGENLGGPLFFEHYSFMGINPNGLVDQYASYQSQTINHTKINYEYCKANPKGWYGYSDQCWGLSASDIPNGYTASSPTNDVGVIAPTAALSSFPYTPDKSMKALKHFYNDLGDKIWGQYGFVDGFSESKDWYAQSYLAIDQGPIVVMIENYRTGLLWKLFMSVPEVQNGLKKLGFQSPWLK